MKKSFFLFTIIFIQSIFSQNNDLNSKKVKDILSNKQLFSCNNDSLFYESDTLYFYDNLIPKNCTKYIIWGLKKRKKFYQVPGESFHHYSAIKVINKDDWFTYKILKKNNTFFIELYKNGKYNSSLKIHSLNFIQEEKRNRLILIKQN